MKLLQFLRLFDSAFTLSHLPPHLRAFLPRFLSRLLPHGDCEVQSLALKCLSKWRWPWLNPYAPRLQRLVGEATWREEMTAFHLDPQVSPIAAAHRRPLAAVLMRLLYPRLVAARVQRGKATVGQRRAAILAYLAGLQHEEMAPLIATMLAPFTRTLAAASVAEGTTGESERVEVKTVKGKQAAREEDEAVMLQECSPNLPVIDPALIATSVAAGVPTAEVGDVELSKQVGLLRLLEALLSQMRSVVQGYLPHLLVVLLAILHRANARIDQHQQSLADASDPTADDEGEEEVGEDEDADGAMDARREQKELRGIRQLVFSRLATVLDLYPDRFHPVTPGVVDLTPYLGAFLQLAAPSIARVGDGADAAQGRPSCPASSPSPPTPRSSLFWPSPPPSSPPPSPSSVPRRLHLPSSPLS